MFRFCHFVRCGLSIKVFYISWRWRNCGFYRADCCSTVSLDRIKSYIDPWNDPLGTGFQGIQSLFAIAPGGLFGHGYGNSRQKYLYLPEPQNDFIFSIIAEETGFIGATVVLLLFVMLLVTTFGIAIRTERTLCISYGGWDGIDDYFSNIFECRCRIGVIASNRCYIAIYQLWRLIFNDDMDGGWNHYAFYKQ